MPHTRILTSIFKASNSNGEQSLHLNKDGEGYYFTLLGSFKGERVQFDFDSMTKADLAQHRNQIDFIINADKG